VTDGAGSTAPRRALLLVNRGARRGRQPVDQAVAVLREAGIAVDQRILGRAGAYGIDSLSGYDSLIVGGGDGTLNAAAPAVAGRPITLGILPLGTGNDLARSLGIPLDPIGAARVIAAGHARAVDLGEINGRLFWNVASIGLSVDLAQALSAQTKRRWGRLGYVIAALRTLPRMRPFSAEIIYGGETHRVRTVQVAVGNGRHYGGGMTIDEAASLDDGVLHVYSLEVEHWWQLLLLLPAFRSGRLASCANVRTFTCRELELRTRRPKRVNTDGEITAHTPARFHVLRRAARVYVPADDGSADDGSADDGSDDAPNGAAPP
jgi:YegS/Rv2252/BmrU family lipid kinase